MRLKNAFRFALYGIFALLFVSGAAWIYADQMKSMHGGAAMITLMLLGALGPMHVQRAWRAKKNRATGVVSIAMYGLLIATAFGLYYMGSEALRPWLSTIHIAFGLAVPAVITAHIMVGRASVATVAQQARPQRATAATLVPDDTPADAVLVKIMSKAS
jgi:small-conductance mechanosensitive channel